MTEQPIGVDIKILDKDYRIACPAEEQNELLVSARFLDSRMREIRQTGRVIGTDRIAVLAALNIVHELLQVQNGQPGLDSDLARRLARLEERIGEALSAEAGLDSSPERV